MPSTIDVTPIDETKPAASSPTTASVRANMTAIKTVFLAAKADIELLQTEGVGIVGPAGPQGIQGVQGPAGPVGAGLNILGTLANTGLLPGSATTGDAYLIGGDLYIWNGAAWENVGSVQGPAGPTGATGATGATGPAGPTGPAGQNANVQYVYYGANAATARPDFPIIGWIGDTGVSPSNAIDGDLRFTT